MFNLILCHLPSQTCLYDTCACENSEECMCATLSSYVHACAAEGVSLKGWRTDVCSMSKMNKIDRNAQSK